MALSFPSMAACQLHGSKVKQMAEGYDFIIVGGGSAGSVLAAVFPKTRQPACCFWKQAGVIGIHFTTCLQASRK